MWWRHLGSTIALVLGVTALLGGFASAYRGRGTGAGDLIVSAPIIILGALAYRSAKKRMLGQVPSTAVRRAAEALALLLIVLLVILRENLAALAAAQPVHYVLVPAWAIIAYLAVGFRRPKGAVDTKVFD
jgi:hypothetical protein